MTQEDSIKIFIVEDDPTFLNALAYIVGLNPDYQIYKFQTGKECLNSLHLKPSVITLDYSLPDMEGIDVLQKVKAYNQDIDVIVISGQNDISTAVGLLKMGAYDYLTKPDNPIQMRDQLLNSLSNARKKIKLVQELDNLKEEVRGKYNFSKTIIGQSKSILKVFNILEKAVKTNITVSVTGETGTGKEVVAKAVHYNSDRAKKPFVAVNLAAIPKDLVESELFGHEKGAFTGAITRRIGKFEEAADGSIFLDEIGEMELSMQSKLLRVLQEREVTRIGANDVVKLNCRIIVATHKDLGEEVKNGNFREDLYYRLLGLPISLPPLRERGKDVLLIAKFFLRSFAKENNLGKVILDNSAQEKLLKYHYPGNVRELKSIIELATVMCNDNTILDEDIKFNSVFREEDFLMQELTLREFNFRLIQHFLKKYDNNILKVAKVLDIGKSTIYRYLKEMAHPGSEHLEINA